MIHDLIDKIGTMENPTVVGLDPTLELVPNYLKEKYFNELGKTPEAVRKIFLEFNKKIIDNIYDIVPCIKPQIAMYEKFGVQGLAAYIETIEYAKSKGMLIIGDIKRGDISSTASAYAAHIGGTEIEGVSMDLWKEDSITINPYLGYDGIKPFIEACNKNKKSIFVLVKTSNPSSSEIQDLISGNRKIYEHVGELVKAWGLETELKNGYNQVGAVVGATHHSQGVSLRKELKETFFLVPGYGAQGATGKDLVGYFDKLGRGTIVNSSRGIISAYKKNTEYGEEAFGEVSRIAALKMKEDLQLAMEG